MRHAVLVLVLVACAPAQAAPRTPDPATTPCRLVEHEIEKVDQVLWTAAEHHQGSVGTCRITPGVLERQYDVRDDKRLVAVLDPCGIDVRVPGFTSGRVVVGMPLAVAQRYHAAVECHTYDRGTECWDREDDGLDPIVRYVIRDKTVVAIRAGTRCD